MAKSELPEMAMIVAEWDRWAKDNALGGQKGDAVKGLAFYRYLASDRPRLLDFDFAGDKWPMVKIWLQRAGRISD
jgi:hypothetical protein